MFAETQVRQKPLWIAVIRVIFSHSEEANATEESLKLTRHSEQGEQRAKGGAVPV